MQSKSKAVHHMSISSTEEKWKLGAPDGERPVPAGPLSRHEARPSHAAEAGPPAGRGKHVTESHQRQPTLNPQNQCQAGERTKWQRPGALLRLHVRPARRLLNQATAVHDADARRRPGPATGHDLRPPVVCTGRESKRVSERRY